MNYHLFIDTETTGFTQKDLPPDHPSQPRLVQLGAILCDEAGNEVQTADLIVKPTGYVIPVEASNVHGITTEMALAIGLPLLTVMSVFTNMRACAVEVVAFNMDFDDLVMRAAISRTGKTPSHPGPDKLVCCMREAGPIMNLPPTKKMLAVGFDKWKPPNLKEAYQFFFEKDFSGRAHSAMADARAAKDIYYEMKRRREEIPF